MANTKSKLGMKLEELPSGSYRIRKMCEGKSISVVFNHEPTESEILSAIADKMAHIEASSTSDLTFKQAAEKYIDMKINVLSPNTVREYKSTIGRLAEWFTGMKISDINQISINKQVNELAANKSPKTVRNYHGFISAVLGTFKPEMNISTTLPQKHKYEPYTPSQDDVKRILEEVKGTEFYVPFVLACHGMRRGEICALTPEDIEGDVVHINKAMAFNSDKEWVLKKPKTTSSERTIIIPMEIADQIKKQGYVYIGHPGNLTKHLRLVQKKLKIPEFSLHKLRHYFASVLSENGVPEADILALGGWETDYVMKNVYRHSMMSKDEKKKRNAMSQLKGSIF